MKKCYSLGDIVKFNYEHDGLVELDHSFILANCHEEGYAFQLICISGYHAGEFEGYIKEEKPEKLEVSREHLAEELNRNFIGILWESFEDIS